MSAATSPELDVVLEFLALRRGTRGGSLAERRAAYERAAEAFAAPGAGSPEASPAAGGRGEWVRGGLTAAPVLVYLHGGSYTLGSARSHRHLSATLGEATGAAVLAVEYRRAPEHPFPAAVEDAVAAYGWLLEQGLDARRTVLAGDSAGAGLALATMLALRDAGRPLPAGAACLSPWVDLTCGGETHRTHASRDPLLDSADLRRMAALYLGRADPRAPLASPAHADLGGLPPLLVQVGSEEILLDDARALARAAGAAGTPVTLREWPGMFHVWQWYHPVLAEGRAAVAEAAAFLRRCLDRGACA